MKQKGTIEALKQRDSGYSIRMDGEWYSAFGKSTTKVGDDVEFEWKQNGDFKNFDKLEITNVSPEKVNPIEVSTEKRRILDCVLAVFNQDNKLGQDKEVIKTVAKNLYDAHLEIYESNHAGKEDVFNRNGA